MCTEHDFILYNIIYIIYIIIVTTTRNSRDRAVFRMVKNYDNRIESREMCVTRYYRYY